MNNSLSKEELENKPKASDETLESGNDPTDSKKIYEVIVAGGENKKSVEHILLPACLPKEKNLLARLWSAIFSKSSENPQSKTDEANLLGKWSYLKPMRNRREAFMTAIYQDQMFAFGTRSGARCFETLDLSNPRARWQYHGDILSEYISAPAAVVYGDSVYIFGGNIQRGASTNVYRFSLVPPYTGDLICQMPEPRSSHNAEIFDDKVIILCGSSTGFPWANDLVDTVMQYDITNNSFNTLPSLPVKVVYAATAKWRDNVLIVGGRGEQYHDTNTVWMYNVSSGESQKLRPMRCKRNSCAAVVAGDMLVVTGGQNSRAFELVSAECYNFHTSKWTELPPMKQARNCPSAVVRYRTVDREQVPAGRQPVKEEN
ncbi:kinase [Paramuricea clavata]|uniref:Kinase n=1 Tax=Paramuricea clavata TaxID=317549 RepID=A0A7D9DE28_PARCT|nr:kinase [Paramuricea clavata]